MTKTNVELVTDDVVDDLPEKQREFLSVVCIRARGWSPAMIRDFLGEPHRLAPNPHYRSAAAMGLYSFERVMEEERKPAVKAALEVAAERRRVRERVTQAQTEALLKQVKRLKVVVRPCSRERLLACAIEAYNHHNWDAEEYASKDSDQAFLLRIQVNYVRHELTRYDTALEKVARRVGVRQAEDVIREKVYAAIKKAYPEFSAECDTQLERRREYW